MNKGYRVSSPSFVLINEYPGRIPLYHIDLYRLTGLEDWPNLGVEDRMDQGVALVEWGDRIEDVFGDDALVVELHSGEKETDRVVHLRWSDPRLSMLEKPE